MNSRERIFAVLNGEKPDMVPVFPKIAFANVIFCDGMTVNDYFTKAECMAEACLTAYRRFHWDGVAVHTDISSEGRPLGSVYERPVDAPPILKKHLLDQIDQLDRIIIPDPYENKDMRVVLDAMKMVRSEIGKEAFLLGWTNAPLNVASQIYRLDDLLMDLIEDPDAVHALLSKCLKVSVSYAKALIECGADMIAFGHATASSNVISKEYYYEYALPYEKQLIQSIHDHGAKACTHICGNIENIVDAIAQNGSDVIDFDHMNDIRLLRKKAPGKVFRGNINPALFAVGTPDEITESVRELLSKDEEPSKLLLCSGCEINLKTPPENVQAFVDAGRKYGKL